MRKVPETLFQITSVLVFVAGAFVLQRVLDLDRVCVAWDGVKQLQFGQETVPACNGIDRMSRPKVSEATRSLVERLNKLSRLSILTAKHTPVSVLVSNNNEVKNGAVSMDESLVAHPYHFERTVMLAWVQRNYPERDELTQEVMTDLLTWSAIGATTWADPSTGQKVQTVDQLKFSLMPRTFERYCQSPFRSAAEFEDCELNPSKIETTAIAMRPLISWTLWNYVDSLGASANIAFFQNMMLKHSASPTAAPTEELQAWTRETTQQLAKQWQSPTQFNISKMKRYLYLAELSQPVDLDLTVQVANPALRAQTLDSLRRWIGASKKRRILYADGEKKIILPENVPVELSNKEVRTNQFVLIACEWPKAKDTMNLESRRLMAVKACDEANIPSWTEVFTAAQGFNNPASRNLLAQ